MLRKLLFVGVVALAPTAALACEPEQFTLALDVGHSKARPGAISARGVPEFSFNRRLARELRDALHLAGFTQTFLINAEGKRLALRARPEQAATRGADLFLSVHHDSVQPQYLSDWTVDGRPQRYTDTIAGYSLFVSERNAHFRASKAFAVTLGEALRRQGLAPTLHHAEAIPGENRPLLDPARGVYQFDGLAVLRHARMPAVLLEAGVIVNRDEELQLNDPAYRARIAAALVEVVQVVCAAGP